MCDALSALWGTWERCAAGAFVHTLPLASHCPDLRVPSLPHEGFSSGLSAQGGAVSACLLKEGTWGGSISRLPGGGVGTRPHPRGMVTFRAGRMGATCLRTEEPVPREMPVTLAPLPSAQGPYCALVALAVL